MKQRLLILTLSAAASLCAQGLVPAPIELPRPGYEGTPANLNVPNLEKPSTKPRPPFLVPAGVTNVALEKEVTSSEKWPLVGELEMVTDGDVEQAEGSAVELGPGLQWIAIDLGAPKEVYGILVWHHFQPRAYLSVVVQTADDAEFTKNVKTWFNNDAENVAGQGVGKDMHYIESYEGRLIDAKGMVARHVRLFSAGNNANKLNHYVEVEVYGRDVQ